MIGVYGHYEWLYNEWLQTQKGDTGAKELRPNMTATSMRLPKEDWYAKGTNLREIEFWLA
jgi:hypothetical protein